MAIRSFSNPTVAKPGCAGSSLLWENQSTAIRNPYAATTASAGERSINASVRLVRTEDIASEYPIPRRFLSTERSLRTAGIQSRQSAVWLHFALISMIGDIDTSATTLRSLGREYLLPPEDHSSPGCDHFLAVGNDSGGRRYSRPNERSVVALVS